MNKIKIAKQLVKLAKSLLANNTEINVSMEYDINIKDIYSLFNANKNKIAQENHQHIPELFDTINHKEPVLFKDEKLCVKHDENGENLSDYRGNKFEQLPFNENWKHGQPYYDLNEIKELIKNLNPRIIRRMDRGRSNPQKTVHIDDEKFQQIFLSLTQSNYEETSIKKPICDIYRVDPYYWQGYVIDENGQKKIEQRKKDLYIKVSIIQNSRNKVKVLLLYSFHL